MTKLEETICEVLEQQKHELASETWESRRRYFNQMIQCAELLGISEPCSELYEAFIADDNGSPERRSLHIRCVKLIDKVAGTQAKNEHNILYNEPPLPCEVEAQMFWCDRKYPVTADVCIDYVVIKAEIEMRYLQLTTSTVGQYKHALMDIRRYFYDAGTYEYNEALLQKYVLRINDLRNNGLMKEWKWKINRKAAYVLIEVANTGSFIWQHINNRICYDNPSLNNVRSQYLKTLEQRNLSTSTISLHDYVLRNSLIFAGVETQNDIALLTPETIQFIIVSFSNICNKRSIATILPILRSQLGYFCTVGLAKSDLSGVVMSAFVQRGSVATYISVSDQEKLITELENESKRNKAIILLALKLGLRDGDICGLTFGDIDWRKDKIKLNQEKTGEPLILPLLPDVGNALYDYIVNERPKRANHYQYVFLREQAPHNRINSTYHICSGFLNRHSIKPINGKAKGAHTLRYSMVYRLLSAKVPHQVITDSLGHSSKESDKPYISMEAPMLRMCALDLSVIGRVSWKGALLND
jgi:integrase